VELAARGIRDHDYRHRLQLGNTPRRDHDCRIAAYDDIALRVGTYFEQSVEVTARFLTSLQSSDISAVVTASTVRETPSEWSQLDRPRGLQPGVSTIQTQPNFRRWADRGNRGFGSNSRSPAPGRSRTYYRLDGISLNDYRTAHRGSVLGATWVSTQFRNFPAEPAITRRNMGRLGGVVNAITRSGTHMTSTAAPTSS